MNNDAEDDEKKIPNEANEVNTMKKLQSAQRIIRQTHTVPESKLLFFCCFFMCVSEKKAWWTIRARTGFSFLWPFFTLCFLLLLTSFDILPRVFIASAHLCRNSSKYISVCFLVCFALLFRVNFSVFCLLFVSVLTRTLFDFEFSKQQFKYKT